MGGHWSTVVKPVTAARVLLGVSVVLQVYILITWATLYSILRLRIWLCAATGLCLITVYRVTEFFETQPYQDALAFFISLFFAWACFESRRQIKASRAMSERLRREAHRPVEPTAEPITVAKELAVVLNDFHEKIDYYEKKADQHNFPKFKTANAK